MTAEEIKKVYMNNEQLGEEEVRNVTHSVAWFKRTLEVLYLIPGAWEEFCQDTEAFFDKYGIKNVDAEGVMQLYDEKTAKSLASLSEDEQLKTVTYQACRYRQYSLNKIAHRDKLLYTYNVPTNTTLKKWRERQIERAKGVCGRGYSANVHVCVSYELTDGCSVGCPFCGVGAEKLKKVFTYDEENVRLFRESLKVMHEIIGDAAGHGSMYLENEPLDNRDYEKFLEAFLDEFNVLPQITTAVATRDIERMRKLLLQLNSFRAGTYYRFSVKSVEEAEEILNAFTPEELLRVELLPQYEEAPGFEGFAKAGRELEREANETTDKDTTKEKNVVPSICCLSGFVINFARKDVRFITNYPADEKHTNGEIIISKKAFENAEDLKTIIKSMISEHIVNTLPSDKVLKPYEYYDIKEDENNEEAIVSYAGYTRPINGPFKGFSEVVKLLFEGKYTKKEIAEILYKTKGIDITETYFCLRTLFLNGIINEYEW